MPPAAVYLVKLLSIARTAACLMFSGVGKSGSPAPSATTSTPARLSLAASAVTAMVADSLIRPTRSENVIVTDYTLSESATLSAWSRSATMGGTRSSIRPPWRQTSLTSLELR